MTHPKYLQIADFTYDLPEEFIAWHPLEERDQSKLLIWENDEIKSDIFSNIINYLPENSLLISNNSKVIHARILFKKTTGAQIEIFCLEPILHQNDYQSALHSTKKSSWKCLVGGAAKWKDDILEKEIDFAGEKIVLQAKKINQTKDHFEIEFEWNNPKFDFLQIITEAGSLPLPPYIKRKAEEKDENDYQTVFAKKDGSVAAPTAGLHFTEKVLNQLSEKYISTDQVTLHVGAGTFKPVKSDSMQDHEMHSEYIEVKKETIENILNAEEIIVVGTTSLRTVESLFWMGLKVILNPNENDLMIQQWDIYEDQYANSKISKKESLSALLNWMKKNNLETIFTQTQILIAPGYSFKIVDKLITNFHQPKSTLLLLVAAAVGEKWKDLYQFALKNNFRFLSYGDANLLSIRKKII